jgi:tRNA(Ile)-lysidine synthase
MHDFVRGLITEWRRLELPESEAAFVVAVSGGADSISLLLALNELMIEKKLDLRFVVAHFNHRLRGEASDADEEFVKNLTTELEMELALGHAAGEHNKGNLEQNARDGRYKFLGDVAVRTGAVGVLTAHTVNDQAETVLMNFLRGSGAAGLAGMRAKRPLRLEIADEIADDESGEPMLPFAQDIVLARPLLTWAKRVETEGFCREKGVEYRYDTMNEDVAFKRVRIRKVLLPLLKEFNPNIIDTMARTAAAMQKLAESEMAEPSVDIEPAELDQAELLRLSPRELNRTLRAWLNEHRGNSRRLGLKHIEAVERLLTSRKSGRVVELPGSAQVVKRGGRLIFEKL